MKTRNGFISNSSSCSFIVRGDSISKIAKSMLNTVIYDWSNWDEITRQVQETYNVWRKILEMGLNNKKIKNGQIGITMPSSNYETYIFKKNNNIYVSTANNHQWDYEAIGYVVNTGNGADSGISDAVHKYIGNQKYFNVRNGLIHSKTKWARKNFSDDIKKNCPHCKNYYGEYVLVGKKKICAKCYKGIIGTKKIIDYSFDKINKEEKELIKLMENKPKIYNVIDTLEL